MGPDDAGIELLLSQPEIVAWLGLSEPGEVPVTPAPASVRPRSEAERLRALIDNMPAHVYVRDLDGRFILVNRQYQEFWGVPHDAIRGKTLAETDRISEADLAPSVNEQIDREVLVTREPRRREARVMRRGEEHVFSDMRFPVVDDGGELVALAGIDIDITTQKRAEAELVRRIETARDAAVEATAAKSRLLATMSRQLREPLNAVIGSIRNAQEAEQLDDLGELLVSAEHLLGLIEEISDLADLEAGDQREWSSGESRRADSNRGPLHYE